MVSQSESILLRLNNRIFSIRFFHTFVFIFPYPFPCLYLPHKIVLSIFTANSVHVSVVSAFFLLVFSPYDKGSFVCKCNALHVSSIKCDYVEWFALFVAIKKSQFIIHLQSEMLLSIIFFFRSLFTPPKCREYFHRFLFFRKKKFNRWEKIADCKRKSEARLLKGIERE